MKRKLSLLLAFVMILTLVPMTAFAATKTSTVGTVPNIANTGTYTLSSIRIDEDVLGNFAIGDVIVLTLPSGVEFNGTPTATVTNTGTPTLTATVTPVTSRIINVTIGGTLDTVKSVITVTMPVNVTSKGTGDIKLDVAAPGTAITEGEFVIGRFVTGSASARALATPSRGGNANYGVIRITENSVGALKVGDTIVLKLPAGFTWTSNPAVTVSNNTNIGTPTGSGTRTLTYTVVAAGSTHPAIIDITTPVTVGSSANFGDIEVTFGGTSGMTGDVLIGKYVDYGVTVTAADAKNVTSAIDDQRIANVTIKEGIAGSLIPSRTITFTLPTGTRFNEAPTVNLVSGNNIWASTTATLSDSDRRATITLAATASTTAAELRLHNADIDVAANFSGDVTVVVGGTAGARGELVVAKATPIVTVTSEAKDIRVGVQGQEVGDVIIVEGAAEAIATGTGTNHIDLVAPAGVTFTAVPKVQVVEGNFEVDGITLVGSNVIRITTKTQSTKAGSKIKVSGIKVTANRAVPEGEVALTVEGTAIMQNSPDFSNVNDAGEVVVAKVVTPAPGQVTRPQVAFTIGSKSYRVGEAVVTADVAPFIKDNRTMVPVRFVGEALGVDQRNIIWDSSARTVTILGERTIQLTIGSPTLLVNGAPLTMDTSAIISNDRTFVPIAWIAMAMGVEYTWDAATYTVTFK